MSIENSNKDANFTSLVNLQKEINTINGKVNEIILNNRSQKKKISELTAENNLFELIYDMEIETNNLNQYTRRDNIEIRNISGKIVERHLEAYVLKVFLMAVHCMSKIRK